MRPDTGVTWHEGQRFVQLPEGRVGRDLGLRPDQDSSNLGFLPASLLGPLFGLRCRLDLRLSSTLLFRPLRGQSLAASSLLCLQAGLLVTTQCLRVLLLLPLGQRCGRRHALRQSCVAH